MGDRGVEGGVALGGDCGDVPLSENTLPAKDAGEPVRCEVIGDDHDVTVARFPGWGLRCAGGFPLAQILIEKGGDGGVGDELVLELDHAVPFVREVKELDGAAAALQR